MIKPKHCLLFTHLTNILLLGLTVVACSPSPNLNMISPSNTAIATTDPTVTPTPLLATPTLTQTKTPSPYPTTLVPTHTPTSITDLCKRPDDNYERVRINNHRLNQRTISMLEYAQTLYSGEIDIRGDAITQGSYTSAVDASFGTHAGGGAVDLSVMAPGTYTILEEDIEPIIQALRLAGFAAWYRDFDDLYPGSPVHIHAIAIGDKELSWPALLQLTGPHGYFLGFNGLPGDRTKPDPHGGPLICDWMIEMGYFAYTPTPGQND